MRSLDLSVEICGVKFTNPVMGGAGDLASTFASCKTMINAGVGGIVTKTLTSEEAPRTRPRPHTFAIHGRGFDQSGCLVTIVGNWPEHIDAVIEMKIPEFKRMCREAGVPLIVSWYGPMEASNGKLKPGIRETWLRMAEKVEAAGADLQELNIACPLVTGVIREHPFVGFELIKAVSDAGFRAGVKIQISWEPLEQLAKGWAEAGAKFITAHNVDTMGLVIDVEKEMPKYAPAMGGYILGRTLLPWSLSRVVRIKKSVQTPVIALGGAYTAEDALQYLLCGASMVQMHTATYFHGLKVFREAVQGIEDWMERKGYSKIEEFRGRALPMILSWTEIKSRAKYPHVVPPECPYIPAIDMEKCNLCGTCEKSCMFRVFRLEEKSILIDENQCDSCGFCITMCPKKAIKLVDKKDRERVIWDPTEIMAGLYQDLLAELTETE